MTLVETAPPSTLMVPATTSWSEFPTLWPELSQEVWGCVRAAGITSGSPNVMLYRDDVPNVEIGVLCSDPVPLTGRVQVSALPGGRVATATHRGHGAQLGGTHDAVHEWCRAEGHELTSTRWEIYGPHRDDPADSWVEVSWLLA